MLFVDVSTLHQALINRATRPVYLSELTCNGNESLLLDCTSSPSGNCDPAIAAGIRCTGMCFILLVTQKP